MRVFVTGATGYVGHAVAAALRRAGHEVLGLCRSAEKARLIARDEIHPVLGDLNHPSTYGHALDACSVLVHAAFDAQGGVVEPDRTAIAAFLEASKRSPKTVIYTSGVWVYGDTGAGAADETTPSNPVKLVAWRPAHERSILHSADVRGIVLRPGCVYGKAAGLTGDWFAASERNEPVSVVGDGRNRWAMVHLDDLADAYVRAAESNLRGEVLNVTDRSRNTVGDMVRAAARAAGSSRDPVFIPLDDARKSMGDFADCLGLNQHVDSRKAVRLLGWQPRHAGFVDEAAECFEAWRAHVKT
jgi:nucleoside-diphosphate-sugar epimerase